MTLILGIDPDTKNTGLAMVEFDDVVRSTCGQADRLMSISTPVVKWVATARAKGAKVQDRLQPMAEAIAWAMKSIYCQGIAACVIEWQRLRPHGEKNPNSIVDLNGIAGMAAGVWSCNSGAPLFTPIPVQWKGTVPKPIHQKRIMSKVEISPASGFASLNKTARGHIIDAIGLALWGYERIKV